MTSLRRRVAGAAAAVAIVAMVVAGSTAAMSADAAPSGVPASLHGAVETKAMTFGTGVPPSVPSAGGLLVDPGPAYAYVTVDRDEFSGGNVSQTMTARGANLDPGAIAAAALWTRITEPLSRGRVSRARNVPGTPKEKLARWSNHACALGVR